MKHIKLFNGWINEALTADQIANQIQAAISGNGTEESDLSTAIKLIPDSESMVKVNQALKLGMQTKGWEYGSIDDVVNGELGMFDQTYKDQIATHIKNISTKKYSGSVINNQSRIEADKAILVGGLNYRPGDKSTAEQTSILSKSTGLPVKGFNFNDSDDAVLGYLKSNPGIPVFLFSAGCKKAEVLSKSSYVNKNQLYIIEPYATSKNTKDVINTAVNNGVPAKNVYVGNDISRGHGVVNGTSDSKAKSHWDALVSVGNIVTTGVNKSII